MSDVATADRGRVLDAPRVTTTRFMARCAVMAEAGIAFYAVGRSSVPSSRGVVAVADVDTCSMRPTHMYGPVMGVVRVESVPTLVRLIGRPGIYRAQRSAHRFTRAGGLYIYV